MRPLPSPKQPPRLTPLRRLQSGIWLDINRINAVMERRVAALFAEMGLTDITSAQSNVLIVLFRARQPMSARDLSEALNLSEVTVCRFIKALLKQGWISRERDPDDRRSWLITLTERAEAALPRFIQVSDRVLEEAFGGWTPEEIRTVSRLVGFMLDDLNAADRAEQVRAKEARSGTTPAPEASDAGS